MFKSTTKKPSVSAPGYTISEIICQILQTRDRLQIYHWKTKSHAKHKASDELVQSLTANMDRFVETYLGSHPTEDKNFHISEKIELKTCNDTQIQSCLYSLLDYLRDLTEETKTETSIFPKFLRGSGIKDQKKVINTDLLNIRDEMMSEIHKTLYLFTLH
jgi:hypothetical protein